jgi:DNA-binding MarR family transcriptional regulator
VTRPSAVNAAPQRAPDLSQLFTYNISALANVLSRAAAARYSREFGVTLMEWRVIGSLALNAPLSLQEIAHRFDLDKGQASRTVADLLARGLLHRRVNGSDRRSLSLRLTPTGWRLYRRIVESARSRSDRLLGCLGSGERRTFLRAFDKIAAEARAVYLDERTAPPPRRSGARAAPGIRKPHA